MRRGRLLLIAALVLLALGAVSAAVAQAEALQAEALAPEFLCLENCSSTIKATFTGGASEFATLAGKGLTGIGVSGTLENCKELKDNKKGFNLCEPVTLTFTGVKQGIISCRSEMDYGEEKDAIETVLVATDLHLASEETSGGVLQPLVLLRLLGALPGEEGGELTLNCGGGKRS